MKTGTREWSDISFNLESFDGKCTNKCLYCFAGEYFRRYGRTPKQKPIKKYPGIIMFPTRHDITSENVEDCSCVLRGLLSKGNEVLIVTKPNRDCVRVLRHDLAAFRDKITWRMTIGGFSETCEIWEPKAPRTYERIVTLRHTFHNGFKTSVSMEPILETSVEKTITLFHLLEPICTDTIWLGLMNKSDQRIKMNCGNHEQVGMGMRLEMYWDYVHVRQLYESLRNEPKARWKDSIQKILNIDHMGMPISVKGE